MYLNVLNVLSRGISSARLGVSLIVACGIAAKRLAFTAGFEAVVEDERTSLDAWRSNSDTLPLVSLRIFTYDKSKNKMAADDEHVAYKRDPGRARPRKIK